MALHEAGVSGPSDIADLDHAELRHFLGQVPALTALQRTVIISRVGRPVDGT